MTSSASGIGWPSAQSAYAAVERFASSSDSQLAEAKRDELKDQRQVHSDHNIQPRSVRSRDTAMRSASPPSLHSTPKKLDRYGFIVNMDKHGQVHEDYQAEDIPTFRENRIATRRQKKWNDMISTTAIVKRRKLSKRLRKGIPDALRGKVWAILGNVPTRISKNPGRYQELVRQVTSRDATKSFRTTQETIERDIHRTYPRHSMFHEDSDDDDDLLAVLDDTEVSDIIAELEGTLPENNGKSKLAMAEGGQASLRRVLRAYSVYDREVGYCQGMNFIAAMFLTFMSEEEAFWLLVAVMNDKPCRMRGLFGEGMHETHQVLFVADKLLHQFLPKLAKHLQKENVHITMYATQWFLTTYTSSYPFHLVTRVWDVYLGEGWKIVYRVMLALLQNAQPYLLKQKFEEILAYFREMPDQIEGSKIMDLALKIPLRKKHIAKYEREYQAQQQAQQQQRG